MIGDLLKCGQVLFGLIEACSTQSETLELWLVSVIIRINIVICYYNGANIAFLLLTLLVWNENGWQLGLHNLCIGIKETV